MKIILASQSPRRAKALRSLVINFEIIPSEFDERAVKESSPAELVRRLSLEKARVVAKKYPEALIIAGDYVMEMEGKIIGKPKSLEEARQILLKISRRTLKDFAGLAMIYQGLEKSAVTSGKIRLKKYTEKEVDDFISRVNPLDKAGGFAAVSGEGEELVERYEGERGQGYGLPLETLKKFLSEFGLAF